MGCGVTKGPLRKALLAFKVTSVKDYGPLELFPLGNLLAAKGHVDIYDIIHGPHKTSDYVHLLQIY